MQSRETPALPQLSHPSTSSCRISEVYHESIEINMPTGQPIHRNPHVSSYANNVGQNTQLPYQSHNRRDDGNLTSPVPHPGPIPHDPNVREYHRCGKVPFRTGGLPSVSEITGPHSHSGFHATSFHVSTGCIPPPELRETQSRGPPLSTQCPSYPQTEFYPAPYYPIPPPIPDRYDGLHTHHLHRYPPGVYGSDHVPVAPPSMPTHAPVQHPTSEVHAVASAGQSLGSRPPLAYPHTNNAGCNESAHPSGRASLPPTYSTHHGSEETVMSQVAASPIRREDGLVVCSECSEEYGNMHSWRRHAARAHPIEASRMIPCGVCRVLFRNDGNLKRHMRTAHARVPGHLHCQRCEATFTSERALSLHMMKIHANRSGAAQGRVAKRRRTSGLAGTSAASNRSSRRSNPSSTLHKCTSCDYVSKWKGNISRHYDSVHLKLRSHACDMCDRRFNTSSNLAVHRMTHQRQSS